MTHLGSYHLHGKTGNFSLKNRLFALYPFGKLQKIWAVISGDAIFLIFLVCSAELDIPCSRRFSRPSNSIALYMFMHKISTRVVCVNGKHPCNTS